MQRRTVFGLGAAAFGVLALLALVFYRERTIFIDPTFLIFNIVKDGELAIQANRFGSALTQVFPWLAVKLGLSLKWVLLFFSGGVALYYFVLFILTTQAFRNGRLGLVMLLSSVFMVSYTFWWMQIEFAQGIALTLCFFAFLTREKRWEDYGAGEIAAFFLLAFTIIYFHPLLVLVVLYLLVFLWLDKTEYLEAKPAATLLILTVVVYFFKNLVLPQAAYDAGALSGISNFKTMFPRYFDIQANRNFLRYCLTDYYLLPLGLLAASGVYVFGKKWLKLGLMWAAFVGYLLLINVTHHEGMPQFHIESYYLPLGLFVIFPLVYDVFPKIRNPRPLLLLVAVLLAVRLGHIALRSRPYTARIAWEERLLDQTKNLPNKKLIIPQSDVPLDTLVLSWGSSYEFWLLSSLRDPNDVRSIIIDEDPERFNWTLDKNRAFLAEWGVFPYDELPKRYFNFTDETPYVKMRLKK